MCQGRRGLCAVPDTPRYALNLDYPIIRTMPALLTQASIRPARNLAFCYLCGQAFSTQKENHPDHVPPEAIFAQEDRNFPLKVASHRTCNNPQSKSDEVIGQLIAVIHGKQPNSENIRLNHQTFVVQNNNEPILAFINTDLIGQIWRWVRGFHAALYGEFLPFDTKMAIHPPFPCGKMQTDGFTIEKIKDQQYLFVEIIKKNRLAHCTDKIVCNNGKCNYECVWVQMDNGPWACIFALKIYDWIKLADKHFSARGCVGWYQLKSGRPTNGTKWTTLQVPISNLEPLDPFPK